MDSNVNNNEGDENDQKSVIISDIEAMYSNSIASKKSCDEGEIGMITTGKNFNKKFKTKKNRTSGQRIKNNYNNDNDADSKSGSVEQPSTSSTGQLEGIGSNVTIRKSVVKFDNTQSQLNQLNKYNYEIWDELNK